MRNIVINIIGIMIVFFGFQEARAVVNINDGAHHVITSSINDRVNVSNNSFVDITPSGGISNSSSTFVTALEVSSGSATLNGGSIISNSSGNFVYGIYSYGNTPDTSIISIPSGAINVHSQTSYATGVTAGGGSHVSIEGGTFTVGADTSYAQAIQASSSTSQVSISGGTFTVTAGYGYAQAVQTQFSAQVSISGGTFSCAAPQYAETIKATIDSHVSIDGGTFSASSNWRGSVISGTNDSTITINDGIFSINANGTEHSNNSMIRATLGSRISVFGGNYSCVDNNILAIEAGEDSIVSVYGGTFSFPNLPKIYAETDSRIEIYGHDFNLPNGPISALSGMISGTLSDGSPFAWNFYRSSLATIVLVPEPSTLALFLIGTTMLSLFVLRKDKDKGVGSL